MKQMNLDLVRVTEGAAIAAAFYIGSGDKETADKVASEAMVNRLNRMSGSFRIVIGEGKKDNSYGLFKGDIYGDVDVNGGNPDGYDIAVDPIEGTRPTVTSGPEAISVVGLGDLNTLYSTEEYYMNKLAYGPSVAKKVKLSITEPIEQIVKCVALASGKSLREIMVCILDRARHSNYIARLRKMGCRIKLIQDCDVSGAIATCLLDSGIDVLYGVGGAPEAVISACAIKCLRGDFQGQLTDKDGNVLDNKVLTLNDFVKGECSFAATGITDGSLLKGVRFTNGGPVTHSVTMRSESGTVRWLTTFHGN
jgi:fructose-1,6-bisphosphatase II